jgi:ribosomal protein S12 methylthiotransferase accessory factor YcaO
LHVKTATRRMNADPDFHEAVQEARQYHADQLEEELEDMGRASKNPVPHIVRLKALRPAEYIEKQATMTVSAHASLTQEDGKRLLAAMLSQATDATLKALEAVPPPAKDWSAV